MLLVIADRQTLQVGVEIVAHLVLDAPRVSDDEPPLQEEEEPFHRRGADQQKTVADERGAGYCLRQFVDRIADDQGLGQRKRRRCGDADKSKRQRELVTAEI